MAHAAAKLERLKRLVSSMPGCMHWGFVLSWDGNDAVAAGVTKVLLVLDIRAPDPAYCGCVLGCIAVLRVLSAWG